MTDQTVLTQNLAESALRAREVLAACPIYRRHLTPPTRTRSV
ncbi:hypothetical protein [Streptomyces sp. 372A]